MFMALVLVGREPTWTTGYGFFYSQNEKSDQLLGQIFAPAYGLAHRLFGLQRLSHPQKTL